VNTWAIIRGTPARQLYKTNDALPFLNPKLDKQQLLTDAGSLKSTTGAENASITLTLDNRLGQCTRMFANPPLGDVTDVYQDAEQRFTGTITQIDLTATDCRVTVQA
jgi:hypothetical protein